jgi:ABC-type phosphate transport system substrate-binding protein
VRWRWRDIAWRLFRSSATTACRPGPQAPRARLAAVGTGGGNPSATLLGQEHLSGPARVDRAFTGRSRHSEPIGSGGGVEQFIGQSTDFGGSDAFMKDDEIAAAEQARGCEVLHIPTVRCRLRRL